MKIVSRDWLTKVGHSIMSTGEMSTGKTSTVFTGSTGSHCCFHWYFTKLGFVRYNKTNMPCQCGYPDGISPLGRMVFLRDPPSGKPSSLWETFHQDTHTGMSYLYNINQWMCGTFQKFTNNRLMTSLQLKQLGIWNYCKLVFLEQLFIT